MRISDWSSDVCSSDLVVDRNIDENGGFATRCKSEAVQIAVEKILSAQANPDLPFHDLLSIRKHVHLPRPKVVDSRKAKRCDRLEQVESAGTFPRFMALISFVGRVKGFSLRFRDVTICRPLLLIRPPPFLLSPQPKPHTF